MPLRVAIAGSTGLIGTELTRHFERNGDFITRIVRKGRHTELKASYCVARLDPETMTMETDALEGQDVVINLAGASIADQSWSESYKKTIVESRIATTRLLVDTLAKLKKRPAVLLNASAMGYYGNDRMDRIKDESAAAGSGFLSEVCRLWEAAAQSAEALGIRVVFLRFAAVLSPNGGALARMLPVFKWGLGGKLGSGKQPFSWISLSEIPLTVDHIIARDSIRGPVNIASPRTVTNLEFTRTLGEVLRRPVILPVPAFGVRFLFGEMGDELLLNGVNAVPRRLLESGYGFRHPDLKEALTSVLSKNNI